jgi:hypothetical protein
MPSGYETPESALVPARGNRYDDDLWQLIYEYWAFECDRNCSRVHHRLMEKIRQSADEDGVLVDDESLNIPTLRQIQYRARNEDWPARATQEIASIAPKLYSEFNTRLFAQVKAAQEFDGDMLAGVYDSHRSPGMIAIKEKVAARVQTLAGVGTAAGLLKPQLPKSEVHQIVDENTSITDLGRMMREKLDERREGQR